jgi:116 kDa U5 small nuclear ribonucleoprotein component
MYTSVHVLNVSPVDSAIDPDPELRLSPERGNVAFASTDMNWCFTLRSFAQMYADTYGTHSTLIIPSPNINITPTPTGSLEVHSFADRLWGDIYFNTDTRKFTRKAADPETNRTFVHFIMEPLYKLYSHVLSEETDSLKETLVSLGIQLKPVMFKMDVRPLLKAVLDQFFGPATGLVDVIVENVPSPVEGAAVKASFSAAWSIFHLIE